jgi:hypothetical protein
MWLVLFLPIEPSFVGVLGYSIAHTSSISYLSHMDID